MQEGNLILRFEAKDGGLGGLYTLLAAFNESTAMCLAASDA